MPRSHEDYLRAKREGMARLRAKDPDAARRKQREWNDRNRDHVREKIRQYYQRRFFWNKSVRLRGDDRAAARELAALWKAQRGRCALTGRRLDRAAELDHIVARVRGGTDDLANLRWVCHEANFAKRDLSDAEFIALCSDCMRWIGTRIAMVDALTRELVA